MLVVFPCYGHLCAAVGGESFGRTAVGTHHIHVEASLASRCKGYLPAVGTPFGGGIVGGVRRELSGLSARYGHGKDVALILKRDGLPIGRDVAVAHPQWVCLRSCMHRECQCSKCKKFLFHCIDILSI